MRSRKMISRSGAAGAWLVFAVLLLSACGGPGVERPPLDIEPYRVLDVTFRAIV